MQKNDNSNNLPVKNGIDDSGGDNKNKMSKIILPLPGLRFFFTTVWS